ncbi:hypothetical protein [Rhodophyticola porphyridii]|nr:hypothetical protein [Rhodophyticola porphyridii]
MAGWGKFGFFNVVSAFNRVAGLRKTSTAFHYEILLSVVASRESAGLSFIKGIICLVICVPLGFGATLANDLDDSYNILFCDTVEALGENAGQNLAENYLSERDVNVRIFDLARANGEQFDPDLTFVAFDGTNLDSLRDCAEYSGISDVQLFKIVQEQLESHSEPPEIFQHIPGLSGVEELDARWHL